MVQVRTEQDKTLLRRQIASTNAEIDRLVYDLYDLTEAEIRIVDWGFSPSLKLWRTRRRTSCCLCAAYVMVWARLRRRERPDKESRDVV
ncbi:hypothetical protein J7M28_11980 [bacterium]|nr:hypothetical protein [bacterium]